MSHTGSTPSCAAAGGGDGLPVRTDVSSAERQGYVRRDEYLAKGDPGWAPEATLETRKKPPAPEVPGDVFDRQRVIADFDQCAMQQMRCLVLGAGGIGQNVSQLLGRMGVAKIHIIDYDTLDASNLNRQTLGSPDDVGRLKVDVASDSLRRTHAIGNTEVTPHNLDVLAEWPTVVSLARECDVIFNGIDIGASFDHCVSSLSKELCVPLCVGQSYGWTYTSEFYSGSPTTPAAWDEGSVASLFKLDLSGADAATASFADEARRQWGVGGAEFDKIIEGMGQAATPLGSAAAAAYRDRCLELMGGGRVGSLADLRFIPRAKNVATRYIGSWAVPCMGCACSMVGQWTDSFTGLLDDDDTTPEGGAPGSHRSRNPPTYVTYDIRGGCTQSETAARQLAQSAVSGGWAGSVPAEELLSMVLPPVQHAASPSDQAWAALRKLSPKLASDVDQELPSLYYGTSPAFFKAAGSDGGNGGNGGKGGSAEDPSGSSNAVLALTPQDPITPPPGSAALPPNPSCAAAPDLSFYDIADIVPAGGSDAAPHPPPPPGGDAGAPPVVFPTLPCRGLVALGGAVGQQQQRHHHHPHLPDFLGVPLMKCAEGGAASGLASSPIRAVASGIRSAVVWADNCEGGSPSAALPQAFRLKGCGNGEDGCFPLQPVEGGAPGAVTPRGCGFANTALTEARMCRRVAAAGLEVANTPRALWVYGGGGALDSPGSSTPGLHRPLLLPDEAKCCGVFETLGDKRAGDHLVSGLLQLFPLMVCADQASTALSAAVLSGRGGAPGDDILQTDMATACGLPVADCLAALQGELRETPPPRACPGVPPRFARLWNEHVEGLHRGLDQIKRCSSIRSALLHVAQLVGWEAGEAMRLMGAAGISWGTFTDGLGTHCNAHANNMVVKPPGAGRRDRLLAVLDFDMAFDGDTYVPPAPEGGGKGAGFNSFADLAEVLEFERTNGMRQALSGSSFASTGVANNARLPEGYPAEVVLAAFHDQVVSGFDAGLAGAAAPYSPTMHPIVRRLVEMALILTSEVIA